MLTRLFRSKKEEENKTQVQPIDINTECEIARFYLMLTQSKSINEYRSRKKDHKKKINDIVNEFYILN